MAAGETVLYYNPDVNAKNAKLSGVLFRMKVRIRRVQADEIGETVGYLAGLKGFEKKTAAELEALNSTTDPQNTTENMDAVMRSDAVTESDGVQKSGGAVNRDGARVQDETIEKSAGQFGESIGEEMLVLSNFSNSRLNELLAQMRKAGVPKIALKATVTPTNCKWAFYDLYKEIKEEHEQLNAPQQAGKES